MANHFDQMEEMTLSVKMTGDVTVCQNLKQIKKVSFFVYVVIM